MQTQSRTRDTRSKTRESITSGARFLARELLREPVRDAVREALREEALAVQRADSGGDRPNTDGRSSTAREWTEDDVDRDKATDRGSGRSKLTMVLGLIALAGVTMFVRRKRRSSEQSDLSSFDEGGTGAGFEQGTGDAGGGSMSAAPGAGEREGSGASSTSPTE